MYLYFEQPSQATNQITVRKHAGKPHECGVFITNTVTQLCYAIHNVQQRRAGGGVNVCQYAWQIHTEPELQCSKREHLGLITAN